MGPTSVKNSGSHNTPVHQCPLCRCKLDACTNVEDSDKGPSEGDACICFGCGGFLVFKADGTTRAMSNEEFGKLKPGEQSKLIQAAEYFAARKVNAVRGL